MPLLSCFTAFGQLEFSSAPSEAEKIYKSMRSGYRDPRSGEATIDTTPGTHKEAVLYGWAMAIGGARVTVRRAANELRAETSYSQLEAQEARFKMSPAAGDSVSTRRLALAAKQKAARGPRFEAVWEALRAIAGSNLVAYRPMTIAEASSYPLAPGAVDAPGIFRRHDGVAKSIRLLTAVARTGAESQTADLYSFITQSSFVSLSATTATSGVGQSFTGNGGALSVCRFYLKKTGAPTGTAVAKVYAHSGDFGVDGLPSGPALATSEPFAVSDLTGSYVLTDFTFARDNQILLVSATKYVVTLEYSSGDGGNTVDVGTDNLEPSHAGNQVVFDSAWTAPSGIDTIFSVLTGYAMEVAYENWNRSLVEISLVAGDLLCVDPGNWGLAESVVVAGSSGSRADRTFRAVFHRPHSANVYATTGPMPLWSNSKRHALVVVKEAAAVDPATVARIHDLFGRMMRGPTTWAIVQPTTPGAATVGPFVIGDATGSPLGAVPIESITL